MRGGEIGRGEILLLRFWIPSHSGDLKWLSQGPWGVSDTFNECSTIALLVLARSLDTTITKPDDNPLPFLFGFNIYDELVRDIYSHILSTILCL